MLGLRCFRYGSKLATVSFGLCNILNVNCSTSHLICPTICITNIASSRRLYSDSNESRVPPFSNEVVSQIFQDVDFQAIVGDDQELLKKLKIIMLEIEVMRQDGARVPDHISTARWKEILECKSRSQRGKFLSFLFVTEKRKLSEQNKKIAKKKEGIVRREEIKAERSEIKHLFYGVGGNSILLRIYDSKIDHFNNEKVIRAMIHGQKMVLDLSYDVHMTPKESSNCAKQLTNLFAFNRSHDDPYDLHFCNANPNSHLVQKLKGFIPRLYEPDFPINITDKSYLDLFPREKLVYLTPHCREELTEYSHDDIYIIGAMVDKANNDPLSLAKAKKQQLRMAKFPLDRYLTWFQGSKALTINQVLSIMLEYKTTNDWNKALVHVPRRKLLQPHQLEDFKPRKERGFYKRSMNNYR